MSSDSDLDYQSADEDAEFDTGPKNENAQQQQCEPEENPTTPKAREAQEENLKNSVDTKTALHVDDSNEPLESAFSELTTDKESKSEKKEDVPQSRKCDEKCETVSKEDDRSSSPNENDKCAVKEAEKEEKCDVSIDTAKKSDPKIVSESESPQEKQRVVLRLEKLITQKQQVKESPLQKEKASDLVNILEDPYKNQQSSWGFGSWGSSLLSSAASSVSTFSSQVSQGIGTVLETVESTLGAPGPEELAKALNEKKKEEKADASISAEDQTDDTSIKDDSQTDPKVSLLPDVSFWTKAIETTGSKVIMGGLDTLEFIGKKTMTILTEGDPGLRKKRAAFSDGANLSEILREAKARAEEEHENNPENADSIHYSQVFDEKQGLVHLEALEMLSKLSQAKYQRLIMRHSKNVEVKEKVEEIKSICENLPCFDDPSDCEKFDDFETVFKKHSIELSIPVNVESVIKTQRQIHDSICKYENALGESENTPKEIFQSGICSLAEFTAKSIETFHKIAELILVQTRLDQDIEQCATNLTGLTTVMCIEINNLSSRYHKCLDLSIERLEESSSSKNVDTTTLATNLYVEAANSNNYIQDAFQMIVPVLQVCVLEALD